MPKHRTADLGIPTCGCQHGLRPWVSRTFLSRHDLRVVAEVSSQSIHSPDLFELEIFPVKDTLPTVAIRFPKEII
jgi:hypothetical protein